MAGVTIIEAQKLRPGMETPHFRIVGVAAVDFHDRTMTRVKIEPLPGNQITPCARYYAKTAPFQIVKGAA